MLAASDPHSGSVSAKAAIASPPATFGSHSRFCSIVPNSRSRPIPGPAWQRRNRRGREWRASVSRAIARLRTSGRASAVGDAQLQEARPRRAHATSARHSASRSSACGRSRLSRAPILRARPPARGGAARRTASRSSVGHQSPWNSGCLLGREGFVGAAEVIGLHALAPAPRASMLERLLDATLPFGVELPLGHAMGDGSGPRRARAASACASAMHVVDDAVEEAPGKTFLGAHAAAGEQQLGGAAVADDPRQDRAGAHVRAATGRRG